MNLKDMPKKHLPNPDKYDFRDVNYVNGIPFPRLPKEIFDDVPLKEEYRMYSMDYLDTPEAKPIFEKQADIIMEHGYEGIVDVGCRHGPINEILYYRGYTDYQYFGFDTSPQPIAYAQETWQEFDNIEYTVGSWHDRLSVGFDVDCIIWSAVLLYEPDNHLELFTDLHKFYNAPGAIIQEPKKEQHPECWREGLELHTIEDQLYKYNCFHTKYYNIDVPIFSGRRTIVDVRL